MPTTIETDTTICAPVRIRLAGELTMAKDTRTRPLKTAARPSARVSTAHPSSRAPAAKAGAVRGHNGGLALQAKTVQNKTVQAKTVQAKAVQAKTAKAKTAQAKTAQAKTAQAKTAQAKTAQAKTVARKPVRPALPKAAATNTKAQTKPASASVTAKPSVKKTAIVSVAPAAKKTTQIRSLPKPPPAPTKIAATKIAATKPTPRHRPAAALITAPPAKVAPAVSNAKTKPAQNATTISPPASDPARHPKQTTAPLTGKTMSKSSGVELSALSLPNGYRPTDDEPFMSPLQRAYFRAKLQKWKDDIIKDTMETLQVLHDDTHQHPDLADRATHETDRALELRARDRQRKLISKIEEAMRRIDDGSYGYCEDTGEPINLRRLDARPVAKLSVEAQERHERRERVYRDE
jgi:DnaK suppressor protein